MRKDFSVAMMPFMKKKTVGRREGRKQGSLARTTIYQWINIECPPCTRPWAVAGSQHNLPSWEMRSHVSASSHFRGSVSHVCILRNYRERILSLYNFLEHSKICVLWYIGTSSLPVFQFWGLVSVFWAIPTARSLQSPPHACQCSCPQPRLLETCDFLKWIILPFN